MINPTSDDIGRGVVYRAGYPGAPLEPGVITGLGANDSTFVRYDGKRTSQSTSNADLDWEFQPRAPQEPGDSAREVPIPPSQEGGRAMSGRASQSQPCGDVQTRSHDKPRLLDLFCCAGGAGRGYADAGFEVVGVDKDPQPRYPFAFVQADAMSLDARFLRFFDAIHASPPCQAHSNAQRIQQREHPELIEPIRRKLKASGLPYVIENVEGAPLIDPVMLCGSMPPFAGLRVYRHRLFEVNFDVRRPAHFGHAIKQTKMGRPPRNGEFMHVVGNFSGVQQAREAMGIHWMSRDELREAIPPAFTRYIGEHLLAHLQAQRIAA